MRPVRSSMAVVVILAWVTTVVSAAEKQEKTAAQPLGTFQAKVNQDYLSLVANQAPLVTIYQEIGKQAKITFDSNIGPEEKITIHLDRVSLEEGIKQLAKNATLFYAENPKEKTRRITRVVVLAERKEPGPGQTKGSSQPEKVKETTPQSTTIKKPAPRPEPFKFELDPTKPAEKEKSSKQP